MFGGSFFRANYHYFHHARDVWSIYKLVHYENAILFLLKKQVTNCYKEQV